MSDLPANIPPPPEPPLADPRRRLRDQLVRTNPTAFNDTAIRDFYVDLFLALCAELEHIPGYGLAMMVMAERYAFLTAQMKAYDTQEQPKEGMEYQQIILRFSQVFDRLLKGRDERTADESFKRQFMGSMISAVVDAIEQTVPDREQALRIQAAIAAQLRQESTNPAVANRSSAA